MRVSDIEKLTKPQRSARPVLNLWFFPTVKPVAAEPWGICDLDCREICRLALPYPRIVLTDVCFNPSLTIPVYGGVFNNKTIILFILIRNDRIYSSTLLQPVLDVKSRLL